MCGIGGLYVKEPTDRCNFDAYADAMLLALEHRGTDATGIVSFADGWQPLIEKYAEPAKRFIRMRHELSPASRAVLCHTRLATQGSEKFAVNNHPVEFDGVYVTHNGHIWNDLEVFADLKLERRGQVDSEAIPAMISTYNWRKQLTDALEKLDGDMAIAAAHSAYPGEIVLARGNASPLYVHEAGQFIAWASTPDAIAEAWEAGIGSPPGLHALYRGRVKEGTILRLTPRGVKRAKFRPMEQYDYKRWSMAPAATTFEGSRIWEPCDVCGEYLPSEMLTYYDDHSAACEACVPFMVGDEPRQDICEYCGLRASLVADNDGAYVDKQWICQHCLDDLLDDAVSEICRIY